MVGPVDEITQSEPFQDTTKIIAIGAFPQWQFWSDLMGVRHRGRAYDVPEFLEMAWTHQFKKSRVFCLQPGHNNDTWTDPHFRTVLSRGIQWVAGRL